MRACRRRNGGETGAFRQTEEQRNRAWREQAATADLLDEIGQRLALQGGNPYRARAYSRAAESLRSLIVPLEDMIADGRLRELPGVGAAIAAIIPALHETGTHPMLEALRADIPAGVLEMLAVPGLKPEQVLGLFRELGISSLDELERRRPKAGLAAAQAVRRGIPAAGFCRGSRRCEPASGRIHMHRAAERLAEAEQQLRRAMPESGTSR